MPDPAPTSGDDEPTDGDERTDVDEPTVGDDEPTDVERALEAHEPPSGPRADGPRRNPAPALLASLLGDTLDPGYAAAAARRGQVSSPPRRSRAGMWWYLVAGVLAVGLVLGIAGRATAHSAPSAERSRSALLGDVHDAQQRVAALAASASALASRIRTAQAAAGVAGPLQAVTSMEQLGAMAAVHGPGLRIVIDNSSRGSGQGVILDRDVQLLVNGLWASGAEAITVGGVRLRTTSAIRQAGGAILVDNTPALFPITILAIGDPSRLHVALVSTPGFARFSAFASLYGARFDLSAASALTLPPAPAPELRYATAVPAGG